MRTAALVPARSGSKGIVGKNTRVFHGRPLFAWAVSVGKATCDAVYLSTDQDLEYLAGLYGAGLIHRPAELATDDAPMLGVVRHALRAIVERGSQPPDVMVILQPTAPWRTEEHVREALQTLAETGASSVVSLVQLPAHQAPEFIVRLRGDRVMLPGNGPSRRQDAQPAYVRDGTVYAIRRETIEEGSLYGKDCRGLIIPRNQSVTLDSEEDWATAVAGPIAG